MTTSFKKILLILAILSLEVLSNGVMASGPILTINTTSLSPLSVGSPFNQTIDFKNNVNRQYKGEYICSASGLPAGLNIDSSNCTISGTPTSSGPYSIEIMVCTKGSVYCVKTETPFTGNIEVATNNGVMLNNAKKGTPFNGLSAGIGIVSSTVSANGAKGSSTNIGVTAAYTATTNIGSGVSAGGSANLSFTAGNQGTAGGSSSSLAGPVCELYNPYNHTCNSPGVPPGTITSSASSTTIGPAFTATVGPTFVFNNTIKASVGVGVAAAQVSTSSNAVSNSSTQYGPSTNVSIAAAITDTTSVQLGVSTTRFSSGVTNNAATFGITISLDDQLSLASPNSSVSFDAGVGFVR